MTRLWSALENLFNLRAVPIEWKEQLEHEYARIQRRYLHVTNHIAQAYPCPNPVGENCPRGIVKHDTDNFAAFCRQIPKQCETIYLKKADVILHKFQMEKLACDLVKVLELRALENQTNPHPARPFRLGDLQTSSSELIPVYFQINSPLVDLNTKVQNLSMEVSPPLIILTTSLSGLKEKWLTSWRNNKVAILNITQVISWPLGGDWLKTISLDEAYHDALRPHPVIIPKDREYILEIDLKRFKAIFLGKELDVKHKDFELLACLASEITDPPGPVNRELLLKRVGAIRDDDGNWIYSGILRRRIHNIRKAMKAVTDDKEFKVSNILKTFPKRGYGFIISQEDVLIKQ